MFEEKQTPTESEKLKNWVQSLYRVGLTLAYPRNELELGTNLGLLLIFTRPMELLLGKRVILYNYLSSLFFTGLCLIPSSYNYIRNDLNMNPYAFCFTASSAILFNFTGATKSYKWISALSWVPLLYFIFSHQYYDYEYRPIFLTALLMTLYIKYKFRVF